MNKTQFIDLLERRLTLTTQALLKKQKEYSADQDQLEHFKRAVKIKRATGNNSYTLGHAIMDMALKHYTYIDKMIENPQIVTAEMVDEKLGDFINYLILLEASFKSGWFSDKKA